MIEAVGLTKRSNSLPRRRVDEVLEQVGLTEVARKRSRSSGTRRVR